jgi:hypothetical protein
MKPVSTGTGLIVLSATIAACFAAFRFGGEERAFAETSATNSPAAMPSPSCVPVRTAWFSRVPKLIKNCSSNSQPPVVACEPIEVADVNGDGVNEHFQIASQDLWGGSTVSSYTLATTAFTWWRIQLDQVEIRDGEATQSVTFVFEMDQQIHDALKTLVAGNSLYINKYGQFNNPLLGWAQGWRDCDADGDLDLVFRSDYNTQVWFENTGFQKSPAPNPYDHDHDGSVNTADLSLLLMEFTD